MEVDWASAAGSHVEDKAETKSGVNQTGGEVDQGAGGSDQPSDTNLGGA